MSLENLFLTLFFSVVIAYVAVKLKRKNIVKKSIKTDIFIFTISFLLPLLGVLFIVYYTIKLNFTKKPVQESVN